MPSLNSTLPWNVFSTSNLSEMDVTQSTMKNWPALLIVVIIFFTVVGNILVIMTVSLESKLHTATNFFLCSLALADMLVGFLVMPPSLISILYNYTWPLPEELCPIWIFLDVLLSTASIMHLCAISLDRYMGIYNPIQYNHTNPFFKAKLKIITVWTISTVLSLPIPVMAFQDEDMVFVNGSCVLNEPRFVLVGSFVAFLVPLFIMVVCYYLTLRVLQKQSAAFLPETKSHCKRSSSLLKDRAASKKPLFLHKKLELGSSKSKSKLGMKQAIRNEQRASKVLGVVFFLFVVMWCPFFITNVAIAICQDNCEHLHQLINIFVWVGYVSSGVNPLIYTLFNKTYRHAFLRYLQCKYHEDTTQMK